MKIKKIECFLLLVFSLTFSTIYAQNHVCSQVCDNMQEYANIVNAYRINRGGETQPKAVPVHVFIVRNSNGMYPGGNPANFSKASIDAQLNNVNAYFSGSNITFVNCKITYIDSDILFNLDNGYDSNGNPIGFNQLLGNNDNLDNTSLCLYFVNSFQNSGGYSPLAKSGFPTNIPGGNIGNSNLKHPINTNNYVVSTVLVPEVLAHEFGHFLNLLHSNTGIPSPSIDPTYNNLFKPIGTFDPPARLFISPILNFDDTNTGDMLASTPVDPGFFHCPINSFTDCNNTTCNINDPRGEVYHPDGKNLMRSSLECYDYSFTNEQKELMYYNLTNQVSRKDLILNSNSECGTTPPYGLGDKGCVEPNTPKGLKNHIVNIYDSSRNKSFTKTMFLDVQNDVGVYNLYDLGLEAGNGNARVNIISNTDNWREGVSTADLVRMQKQVLLIEQFNNPYQYLAGDVTYDGKVSTADMVEVRKLILYNIDKFNKVNNWRFVPTYYFDPTVCNFSSFNNNPLIAKCYFNTGIDILEYLPNNQMKTYMDEFSVPLVNTYLRKQSTWNWKAAKSGDVNCSADDTKLKVDNEEKLFLKNLHRCYNTDEYVNFIVKARAEQEVTAWEMGIRLNPDVLEFNALENTNTGTPMDVENFGLTKWNQGQFRALWIDTLLTKINMQNYTELYKLRLKVKQTTCNFDSLFLLSGKVLPTKFYNDTAEIKNVSILLNIEEVNNGNHSQLVKNIYPNPFDKKISIEFELEKEGFAEISLYDNSGRLINNKKEFCNKGINTITFEDNKGYQQGIIHYVITTKEATQSGTILNTKY